MLFSVGDSKSCQSSVASEYSPCSRRVPESELGYKSSLLLCGSRGLALFAVPRAQDWDVAVGWCLAELAEGLKQKLLGRCEVPPFFCWAFKQHNCLTADHFIKWSFYQDHSSFLISSSVLSVFQDSRSLLCCLQRGPHVLCRVCNAEQRQLWINSTRSEFLIASTCLQCPVCSQRAQGVTKVPFVLLLSPVAPKRSVSFFAAVIKPHRKPQVLLNWALRGCTSRQGYLHNLPEISECISGVANNSTVIFLKQLK